MIHSVRDTDRKNRGEGVFLLTRNSSLLNSIQDVPSGMRGVLQHSKESDQ